MDRAFIHQVVKVVDVLVQCRLQLDHALLQQVNLIAVGLRGSVQPQRGGQLVGSELTRKPGNGGQRLLQQLLEHEGDQRANAGGECAIAQQNAQRLGLQSLPKVLRVAAQVQHAQRLGAVRGVDGDAAYCLLLCQFRVACLKHLAPGGLQPGKTDGGLFRNELQLGLDGLGFNVPQRGGQQGHAGVGHIAHHGLELPLVLGAQQPALHAEKDHHAQHRQHDGALDQHAGNGAKGTRGHTAIKAAARSQTGSASPWD